MYLVAFPTVVCPTYWPTSSSQVRFTLFSLTHEAAPTIPSAVDVTLPFSLVQTLVYTGTAFISFSLGTSVRLSVMEFFTKSIEALLPSSDPL